MLLAKTLTIDLITARSSRLSSSTTAGEVVSVRLQTTMSASTVERKVIGLVIAKIRRIVILVPPEGKDQTRDLGIYILYHNAFLEVEGDDIHHQQARVDGGEEIIVAVVLTEGDIEEADIDLEVIPSQNHHQKSIFQDTFLKNIYSSRKESSR